MSESERIFAAESRCQQVFVNLLVNAPHAIEFKGVINHHAEALWEYLNGLRRRQRIDLYRKTSNHASERRKGGP